MIFSICFTIFILIFFITPISAEKWEKIEGEDEISGVVIPEHEYVGYFDSNGVYTVIGAIKNHEPLPVIPTITIIIKDSQQTI